VPRTPGPYAKARRVLFLSAVLLCMQVRPAPAQVSDLDRSVAAGYLRQAEELFASGDDSGALILLGRSLEFHPNCSESLYLQARIQMKRQETLEPARDALERALEAGGWASTPPNRARTDLARLYVWTRRYAAARSLLETLAPDRGLGGAGSADLAELWARTLMGAGGLREAESLLERALRRYPDEAKLYLLAGDLLVQRRQPGQAAQVLDRGLGELARSMELLYARGRVEPTLERRVELLGQYLEGGGIEPGAAALLLVDILSRAAEGDGPGESREELADRAREVMELFLDLGGELQVPLVDGLREALLPRGEAQVDSPMAELQEGLLERLDDALRGYTGDRFVDADRDGLYEERYQYQDGRLRAWVLDEDQNGLPEARVEYEGDEPALLVFPGPGSPDMSVSSLGHVYRRYPYLDELVYAGGGSRRVYEMVPFGYTFDAVEIASAAGDGVLARAAERARGLGNPAEGSPLAPDHPLGRRLRLRGVLSEEQARSRASRMSEYATAGPGAQAPAQRVHLLLSGETVRIDQDPDGQGRYRHRIFYEGGLPVSGLRDLDGDGRFETREVYRAGELREIVLDQDGDGNAEFTELFRPDAATRSEKRWDYDSDGRIDSRQRVLADGSTIREFSSRLDGRFDLRAVFRDGRLEELRRGGRSVSVRYDSSRDVYRIGQIRGWDPLPEPLTEGIHRRGGARLFVFEHAGKIYIGEVE